MRTEDDVIRDVHEVFVLDHSSTAKDLLRKKFGSPSLKAESLNSNDKYLIGITEKRETKKEREARKSQEQEEAIVKHLSQAEEAMDQEKERQKQLLRDVPF